MLPSRRHLSAAAMLCMGSALMAHAQAPVTAMPAPAVAENYQGTLTLNVDLTDLDHRVFKVRETVPVTPGPMKLWYPQWLPGNHAPRGPIESLAGLVITGNGQRIEWTRDPLDIYGFNLVVPQGVTSLELAFEYLSPVVKEQGRIVATPEIVGLQWNAVVLYPAGRSMAETRVQASITLPVDWDAATALSEVARSGDRIGYEPVPLEVLVDSPVFAGKNMRKVPLGNLAGAKVNLSIVADNEAALLATTPQLAAHAKLVPEAQALFGARHFDRYDFLLSLSEQFSGIGLEHHRSSENGVSLEYFTEWDKKQIERSLLPHEFVHSWVGKFRRPAGQMVGHFNTPLQNELLYVYEGQTQYWGQVLSARTGLWSQPFTRESIAYIAATLDLNRPGRDWRSVQDTVHQPIITARRPLSYTSYQRSEDYYNEGLLIWLDVDTQLRELTGEARGLDDFARAFFGPQPGIKDDAFAPLGFRFEDVTAALSAIAPYDWTGFLRSRLDGHGPSAPLKGLERAGWKLAFTDKPTEYVKGIEERNKSSDYSFSLGIVVEKDANLADVVWGSPAFKAGLSKGDTLIAVNGLGYKNERLKAAVKQAQDDQKPIELLLKNLDHYRTVKLSYTGGLRYPTLAPIEGRKDRLTAILSTKAP
ncbi:MAG: peptidase M61 [Pseudomonadota bacterium]